jgi:gentisate 1,2-dioxygenase
MNSKHAASIDRGHDTRNLREDFYKRAAAQKLSPLWVILDTIATNTPRSACVPAIWRYADVRPYLTEAAALITPEEAERRVMVLENPGITRGNRITQSLYAGLQIVLPGEIAPPHRHTANALRFIIEGTGAYTSVDGEKTVLHPGDFVVTPGWTWHDHGNETSEPVVWMDGLDVHIINLFDASFREPYPAKTFPQTRREGASYVTHGHNMRPVDHQGSGTRNSPIFNYPYSISREVLHQLSQTSDPDECHGHKMKFTNPVTGDWAMPTISTCMQLLPAGFATKPYRSTDGTIFSIIEGHGRSEIGSESFEWRAKDTFVVPSWTPVRHFPESEAVVFSFSDRAIQEKLGIWREQRGELPS